MTWPNGNVYIGNWNKGKIEGQGKMTWAKGLIYEGNWKDNIPEG